MGRLCLCYENTTLKLHFPTVTGHETQSCVSRHEWNNSLGRHPGDILTMPEPYQLALLDLISQMSGILTLSLMLVEQ